MEVIHHDDGVRQRPGDRGAVDRARVDGHELDLVLPVLAACIEPAGDRRAGAAGDLAEQPPGAGQVGEVGLEPFGPHPLSSLGILGPFRGAAAGLIQAQHHRRVRLRQHGIGVRDELPVRHRPAHPELSGDRGHAAAGGNLPRSLTAQPPGQPRPRRDLGNRLGERPARARRLPAPVLPLMPAHRQRLLAIRQIPRPGRPVLPHRRRDHPALRAPRRAGRRRHHMH